MKRTQDSEHCKNVYGITALRNVWVWTGFIWFRMETSGRHFRPRSWTFGFHKMREIYWLLKKY